MTTRAVRRLRLLAVAGLLLTGAGCGHLFGSHDLAPGGLPVAEDRLRQLLSTGSAGDAVRHLERRSPQDEVLRVLYDGVVAYHAGDWERSAHVLDVAGELADDRITKSLSRSALSLVANDFVLPYEPGRTERLMIPYYAALARTRLGDRAGAAVEARRLSLLLQHYRDSDRSPPASLATALHLAAAAVFEANGDRADADVARRNALALDSTIVADGTGAGGTVYVIVEEGFVTHRVEHGLSVLLLPDEVHAIAKGDADERLLVSGLVASRVLEHAADNAYRGGNLHVPAPHRSALAARRRTDCRAAPIPPAHASSATTADTAAIDTVRPAADAGQAARRDCDARNSDEAVDELPYLLRVAWPSLAPIRGVPSTVRLTAGDATASDTAADDTAPGAAAIAPLVRASVSEGVAADFEAERGAILTRTVARGVAKLALTRGASESIEERNEVAGRIVGLLGNVGSVLLERADVRSWHLLPSSISVLRVTLPPGEHALNVDVDGRTVRVDGVHVAAGRSVVVPVRAW